MCPAPSDVSAVVCTLNSINSIEACLASLSSAGVGQLVVVDGGSHDGSRQVAEIYADLVLEDPGVGLGTARNLGILRTTGKFILNIGSDNVISREALLLMLDYLQKGAHHGVGAVTTVEGETYLARCMNAWWSARFFPGSARVIGTPSLFVGDMLRQHPYDLHRKHSDDSELCERWSRDHGSTFAISSALVKEVGKAQWSEVVMRCRNYGVSDFEVFRAGRDSGWSAKRQLSSVLHPLRVDLLLPMRRTKFPSWVTAFPFFAAFTFMRYWFWLRSAVGLRMS